MALETGLARLRNGRSVRLRIFFMRRILFLILAVVVYGVAAPTAVFAQSQSDQDARDKAQAEEDAKKKKKEKEWDTTPAPLPAVKNAGPCPYVKVLYDAARYVQLKDNREASEAVGWTGEIEGVRSICEYKGAEPIHLQLAVDFAFGKGPQAHGASNPYRYWVAVTARNQTVLDKKYFEVVGEFRPGQDRIFVSDRLQDIVIPRADARVSGSNFEVLVGFDVTPEMADFNRLGKRFRENAVAKAGAGASGGQ
jgi:hypothetical protein